MQTLTPNEAAKIAVVSRPTIMAAIKDQKLQALKGNRGWLIDKDSFDSWLEDRNKKSSRKISDLDAALDADKISSLESDISRLQGELEVKNAVISGKEELIEHLKSELDHLRKPFWLRWRG